MGEIGLRVMFLPVVAFLTQQLAEANRVEARKYQAVAQQLEKRTAISRKPKRQCGGRNALRLWDSFTAGLAHELRNPMGTMRASAEMLLKNVDSQNEVATGTRGVHLLGGGSYEFADHAISGVRAADAPSPGEGGYHAVAGPGHSRVGTA